MYLFKTAGDTFDGVIAHQKHAFKGMPQSWSVGEMVLVSKNRADCEDGESQIQFVMSIVNVRPLLVGEAQTYWPGTKLNRWRYLVLCNETSRILKPFDLTDVLGPYGARPFRTVQTFKQFTSHAERAIFEALRQRGLERVYSID